MATDLVNVRKAFIANPGYFIVDVDYSQIEPRLSAAHSGERPILQGFVADVDYYTNIYHLMSKIPIDQIGKKLRQIGKVINLRLSYGGGVNSLARTLKLGYEETSILLESYWAGQPALTAAINELLVRARSEGGVRTIFGSWMPLPDLSHQENAIRAKAERQCWNRLIQGTAAIWLKIAMLRCDRALVGRDVFMKLTVHDELYFECSVKEKVSEVLWLIRDAFEFKVPDLPVDAALYYQSNRDIYPSGFYVPAAITCGMNWGDQHEISDKTVKDKKTGEPKIIKGWKTISRELGLNLDFDTFEQLVPDYLTPRRNRFFAKPSSSPAEVPQSSPLRDRVAAMISEVRQASVNVVVESYGPAGVVAPVLPPARLRLVQPDEEPPAEEVRVDPYRYPCVVVKLPPVDATEERIVTLAAQTAVGNEWLFLQCGEALVDARRQVDAKAFMAILAKLPRICSILTSERYTAAGQLVRQVF